ncbi:beta strand repeat-containing protein [Luteolibacter soli]|uniref:Autotransporter-associated beta strand repeat-containing protein n=1 Tax=Luteolibacter soli TaxID=3135280 RepID=A0ABU9AXH8_9BACT
MTHLRIPSCRIALLTAATSLTVITAPAATVTWDGGAALWQTPTSWANDIAPAAGDALVFAGANNLASQNDFPAGTNFLGLTINTGSGAFNISGNGIVLDRSAAAGNGLTGGNITNNDDSIQTVGIPLTLSSGNHTFATPAAGGQINLSGTFARSTGSTLVFSRVGGNINFTGSSLANDASGILGGWAVIGNNWAALDGSGNTVPYTAYTNIAAGAVTTGANLNYHYFGDTGNLTAATGTTVNTLTATLGTGRSLTVTGTMKFGNRGGIYRTGASTANSIMTVTGGTITANGGGELNLLDATTSPANFAATNNNLVISSAIADDGANPVSVNILGYLSTTVANTYSGGTYINQGRLQTGNLAAFGTGPVYIYPGGHAFLNTAGNFSNNFFISGQGSSEASGGGTGPGAIRLSTTSGISGTVTLQGNSRIASSSTGGPSITGRITGTGNLETSSFSATGMCLLRLGNTSVTPNDWTGNLNINALSSGRQFTLRLLASGQIPDASTVTIGGSDLSRLDLNGFNETIAGLNCGINANYVVTNLAAAPANSTLTIGTGNANGDFGGKIEEVVGSGTISLVKNGSGKQILRGTTTYSGTTTVNGGTLEAVGNLDALGAISVNSGATLAGNGNVGGNVSVATGGTLRATGIDFGGLNLGGSLDLAAGTTLNIDMTPLPVAPITVAGAITPAGGAGSVTVNLSGVQPVVGSHPLISYSPVGSLAGTGITAFTIINVPPRFAATLSNDPGNKAIMLNVTASNEYPVWSGKLGSEWSTATLTAPKNWTLNTNPLTATDYVLGDHVLFNDNATGTNVDISVADVAPASVGFENETKNYTVTGSRAITGNITLNKTGAGITAIANTNTYTGGTIITFGTIQVGNGGTSGSLGNGEVKNDGTLAFNRSDDFTFANLISGGGEVRHTGSGTTTLSATNTYGGATTVTSGTLRTTNNGSLGSLPGGAVTVQSGGALDISGNPTLNNANYGAKQINITGNGPTGGGALVNAGTVNQQNAFQKLSLDADASVGGTARFDLRGGTPVLTLNNHTLRKRGTNQFTVVSGTIQGPGAIVIEGGTLAAEVNTLTSFAPGEQGTITVEPGANMQFYQNNPAAGGINWPITLRENAAFGNAGAVVASVPANIILEGNALQVSLNSGVRSPISNFPLTLTGIITENGGSYGFTKDGVHTLTLEGIGSSYTGATQVNAGTLVVNGSLTASPVIVASGATLGGGGTLGGSLTSSGIVSPSLAAIGTLSTGATSFSATGSYVAQINSATLTADKLAVTGSLQLGGTLTVTDLGAATLNIGDKLVLASYTGALSGAFNNAPDGGTLTLGSNTFAVDYDDVVAGQTSITLTAAAGSAYDTWASSKGLNATNNGKLQDPDKDGIQNIIEFGLDGNPLGGGNDGKTRLAVADVDPGAGVENALTLTLPVRTGAAFNGPGDLVSDVIDHVIYKIQGSLSLGDFTLLNVTEVTPALSSGMPGLSTGWSYRSFRLPGTPGSPNPKAFLRADVSDAP